ncbi:MAG: YccF domain-containing protein [Ilumatobacter sp.]|uniref:YccF domain-containing protein n=1 Tax=Ilumatobacter sp. TaxID=1967498 RepID=UPI00391B9B67
MKTVGNVLWLVLCGVWIAIGWLFWALLLAVTIVGLPFARQCLKLAEFSLWPFGRTVVNDPSATRLGVLGAVLWIIPGVLMAISYVLTGALLCLTIIGIPFGIQSIKLAGLALQPFGKKIIQTKDTTSFYANSDAARA